MRQGFRVSHCHRLLDNRTEATEHTSETSSSVACVKGCDRRGACSWGWACCLGVVLLGSACNAGALPLQNVEEEISCFQLAIMQITCAMDDKNDAQCTHKE